MIRILKFKFFVKGSIFWITLFLLSLLYFVYSSIPVYTASGVPETISYQGRLADSSGDLLGGDGTSYNFKFSIWDGATIGVGTQLWPAGSPVAVAAVVRQGVFNVDIDVSGYNFNTNNTIYLQIEVSDGGGYETLSPRKQVSATAFAIIAGAVSGTGQSSFGTVTPSANTVVTVVATSSSATPILIQGAASQAANLMRIENSAYTHLFSINPSGAIFTSSTANVQTAVIFGNNFKIEQTGASTAVIYDPSGNSILEFDEDS